MSDLELEMQSILDAARHAHEPKPGDADRVHRALSAAIVGAGTLAGAGSAAAAAGSAAAVGGSSVGSSASLFGIAKCGALGLLVGTATVGVGTVASTVSLWDPAPVAASAPASGTRVEVSPRASVLGPERQLRTEVRAAPSVSPRARNEASAPSRPERAPALGAEARALLRAQRWLEHDPRRTLDLLDTMAGAYPDGVLAEEAQASRVLAHCNLGQRDRARQEAERFITAFPRSVHVARLRSSCAFAPSGESGPTEPGRPSTVEN